MKNINLKIAAVLVGALALSVPASGSEGCLELSREIVKYARANKINKIAMLSFTAKGGAEKNEAEYISEKMGIYLAGDKKPALIERALLEKVLKEAKLSSAANDSPDSAKMLQNILSVDAVVTGTVFAAEKTLKVLARLIDMKTGRVLFAAETETGREWPDFSETASFSMEPFGISGLDAPAGWETAALPTLPPDFRDSVANSEDNSCSGRKQLLTKLNSEFVDTKARYWAARMKEPGFNRRSLTKNPGSEIGDPETKARFYKLLTAYYDSEAPALLAPDKLAGVKSLMETETRVSNECGLY
ncbi:MAG: hypothetical protein A2X34_10775 [Elusimicrobia bacterium GWC2_51_8]|nr:MAG: hypothetical protein A2X33_00775 [Elusimicrobia bacterium GWA2_51_34]OGR61506.1 MAG: hypothetical protein A2X34_10775 [Elusimicrobia bacterium GWC2_51_8]OGR86530.1 MAG: hypothetical protein A2021_06675 [Elusimicrobia bacterium GWF2_52_66]HCE98901.1 hypothetical protein [Elusimicrobiota bacterium]